MTFFPFQFSMTGLTRTSLNGFSFAGDPQASLSPSPGAAPFQLPPLPYAANALEPYMSARTISFHYGKHHQAYVDNLNRLVLGTPWAGQSLEKILRATVGVAEKTAVFNNAAQAWNHSFFWQCMKPHDGGKPTDQMMNLIEKSFGSFDELKKMFVDAAVAQFGSGWIWLVRENDRIQIVKTSNADTPAANGKTALLVCDVWEHAYYLDYQNRRKDFVQAFLDHLANWEFAGTQWNTNKGTGRAGPSGMAQGGTP